MEKECRRCFKGKPLSEYYKHKQMFDGHLNVCIECTKKRVSSHRAKNIEKVKEYDRNRPNKKDRSEATKQRRLWLRNNDKEKYYQQTIEPKEKWQKENPEKRRAHIILGNAVRDKRILKPPLCSECKQTGNIHGHHDDYTKPLEVVWLCSTCHSHLHKDLSRI